MYNCKDVDFRIPIEYRIITTPPCKFRHAKMIKRNINYMTIMLGKHMAIIGVLFNECTPARF